MNGMREVSMITLGVRDIAASSKFYEALGFLRSKMIDSKIVWFRTNSTILGLYPWDLLADDVGTTRQGSGFRGVTLALNMVDKGAVDMMIENVRSLDGDVLKEPQMVFWGGYSSYFSDPDGHLWEVAWNPFSEVDADGRVDMKS